METALPPRTAYAYSCHARQSGPPEPGRRTLATYCAGVFSRYANGSWTSPFPPHSHILDGAILQRFEGIVCRDGKCLGVCGGPVFRVAVAWTGGRRLDASSKVPGRGLLPVRDQVLDRGRVDKGEVVLD